MAKVFIGVGHGGSDPGAVDRVVEKDAVLTIALAAKAELERHGVKVGISRTTDEEGSLTKEIRMANAFDPDIAIEIHANAGGGDGFEAYVQTNRFAGRSRSCAKSIEERVEELGQNSRGIKTKLGSYGDYYAWLREVDYPAVLLEGFFVDSGDASDFDTTAEQQALGRAYAHGVLDHLGIRVDTLPFADVPVGTVLYDAVKWALGKGITSGVDAAHFAPDRPCTRAHAVTMLWALRGKPQRAGKAFEDVKPTDYFSAAVAWASAEGVTAGVDDTHFAPRQPCTRAQIITMLWAAAGKPEPETYQPFEDVAPAAYYAKAAQWARDKGITAGVGGNRFAPDDICTRGQIVMMLRWA